MRSSTTTSDTILPTGVGRSDLRAAGGRSPNAVACLVLVGLVAALVPSVTATSSAEAGTQTWIGLLAGNGATGGGIGDPADGGPATDAPVGMPMGVAVGPSGDIYVGTWDQPALRRIDTQGKITRLSSGGSTANGIHVSQAVLSPSAVATDLSGNIFVADDTPAGPRVRRVDAQSGIVTTVAGNGQYASSGDGGLAVNAGVRASDIAIADDGTLYIAEQAGNRVRKVTPDGWISTIAGTGTAGYSGDGGPAVQARLNKPSGVTVDEIGNVYIADKANHRVRKVDAITGLIETVAGNGGKGFSGDGGLGTAAQLNEPARLTFSPMSRALYISDSLNHRVRQVNAAGVIATVAGTGATGYSGDGGPASDAKFTTPFALALTATGSLYVADLWNHRVRQILGVEGLCELIEGSVTTAAGAPLPGVEVVSDDPEALDDCPTPVQALSDSAGHYALFVRKATGPLRRLTAVKAGYLEREVVHPLETTIVMYQSASTWTDPGCEEDGNPLAGEPECTPPGGLSDPITTSGIDCQGAIYCDATMAEVQAMGFDTTELLVIEAMLAADETLDVVLDELEGEDPLSQESTQAQATQSSSGPVGGLYFYLLPNRGNNCQYSPRFSGNCGYLIHFYWTGHSPTRYTWYPASSGNNNPAEQCVSNKGPIPLNVDGKKLRYNWGYRLGEFTAYRDRNDPPWYPGFWDLDPWVVRNCQGTTRSAFQIHGGQTSTGASRLDTVPTLGCIRLSIGGIRSLKSFWDHRTPNRQSGGSLVAIDYSRV